MHGSCAAFLHRSNYEWTMQAPHIWMSIDLSSQACIVLWARAYGSDMTFKSEHLPLCLKLWHWAAQVLKQLWGLAWIIKVWKDGGSTGARQVFWRKCLIMVVCTQSLWLHRDFHQPCILHKMLTMCCPSLIAMLCISVCLGQAAAGWVVIWEPKQWQSILAFTEIWTSFLYRHSPQCNIQGTKVILPRLSFSYCCKAVLLRVDLISWSFNFPWSSELWKRELCDWLCTAEIMPSPNSSIIVVSLKLLRQPMHCCHYDHHISILLPWPSANGLLQMEDQAPLQFGSTVLHINGGSSSYEQTRQDAREHQNKQNFLISQFSSIQAACCQQWEQYPPRWWQCLFQTSSFCSSSASSTCEPCRLSFLCKTGTV